MSIATRDATMTRRFVMAGLVPAIYVFGLLRT
jgi:hypothetical protein